MFAHSIACRKRAKDKLVDYSGIASEEQTKADVVNTLERDIVAADCEIDLIKTHLQIIAETDSELAVHIAVSPSACARGGSMLCRAVP